MTLRLDEQLVHARSRLRSALYLADLYPEDAAYRVAAEARQKELDRLERLQAQRLL